MTRNHTRYLYRTERRESAQVRKERLRTSERLKGKWMGESVLPCEEGATEETIESEGASQGETIRNKGKRDHVRGNS